MELVKDGHLEITSHQDSLKACPECGEGTLRKKEGKYGPFEACSMYPDCAYTKSLKADESSNFL